MKESLSPFARRTSLRQLRAFGAVIATGTISGAAERLGLTPPAIGQQLRLLESALDDIPLLERVGAARRPTEAGREVLAALERIEAALGDCAEAVEALQGIGRGRIGVGVISTAKYFAPFALAAFSRAQPGLELRISVGNRQDIIAGLGSLEMDLAIMGRPPDELPIERAVIGEHPHVIIAAPGHRLASRRGLALAELAHETFLLREPGSGTRDLMRRVFADAGLKLPDGVEIGSNETIKQAAMAGMGIALLSAHTISAELRDGRLILLSVQGLPVMRQWFVVRHREKRLLPAALALWTFLAERGCDFLPSTRRDDVELDG